METSSQLKSPPGENSKTSPDLPEAHAHDLNASYAHARKRKTDSNDSAKLVTPTKMKKKYKANSKAQQSPQKNKEDKETPTEHKQKSKTALETKKTQSKTQSKIERFYPNKFLKADNYLQAYDGVAMLDMLRDPPQEILFKDAAFGLFTLVYVNKFNLDSEGNVYPILRALGSVRDVTNAYNKAPPGLDQQFAEGNRICAIAPRRLSKQVNLPITKNIGKPGTDKVYKECVFIVALLNSTFDKKREILLEMCTVSSSITQSILSETSI